MLYRLTIIASDNSVKERTVETAREARDVYNALMEQDNYTILIAEITKLTARQLYDRAQLEEECEAITSQYDQLADSKYPTR